MTEAKTAGTAAEKQSLELMTKMMLMKNSKSKSHADDSAQWHGKNMQITGP